MNALSHITPEQYEAIIHSGSHVAYSAMVFLGMVLGGALIRHDSATWNITAVQRYSVLAVSLIGALIGCALPAYIAGDVIEKIALVSIISPKTILGGILGSFFAVAFYKKLTGLDYDTSDAFARGGCLMMAIGRIGCILQHCCFGIAVPPSYGIDFGDGVPRLPTQAIEAACLFGLFFYLNALHKQNKYPHKRLFILFVAYGVIRFMMEFLREQIAATYFGIGFYQYLALVVFAVGIFQILKRNRLTYAEAVS